MIRPEIGLSDIYLNLTAETGSSLEGSFRIYSTNGQELEGRVVSTNDKVVVRTTELSGTECEISYYFKGKMAVAGEEHYGDFLLLTNGGERNIPYCVTVVPKTYWFGDRKISDLDEFYEFAQEDWKRARDIFFTKDFPEILLAQREEERTLYHDLLKGYSKDMIMDQFFTDTMGKSPARFETDIREIVIDESKVGRVTVTMEGWGCMEGRIYSERGNLLLNRERFSQDDFQNGSVQLFLSLREACRKDVLVIETGFEQIRIPVRRKFSFASVKKKRTDRAFGKLLRSYLSFRTGKITMEEYVELSLKELTVRGSFYELYCLLLLTIQKQSDQKSAEECDLFAARIEEKKERYLNDPSVASFYYYVMALWRKEPSYTKEAVRQIRMHEEQTESFYDDLLLLFLDDSVAFSCREQIKILVKYLEQGNRSPLLYLALLDVLNQEPYLLEYLDEKRADVICWGMRHQYLSRELTEQFETMALREKNFQPDQWRVLLRLYEQQKSTLCLKAICSLLMKGNKTESCYHPFFADAVEQNLNLIGLNEYYLRTIPHDTYPQLPEIILYYFHYSNSLDKKEKAWLYLNIVLHEEEYGEIYRNYYPKILAFVKAQLMEGRLNRHLKQLYEKVLPELLEEKELIQYLPNIIFKKKITCYHPVIEGIYVCHPENEEETYVPLMDGKCQLELYSLNARIYFADRMGNRYHSGISYFLENYLEEDDFRGACLKYCNDNRKVLIRWLKMEEQDKKEAIARLLLQKEEGTSWKRERAVEQILDYHYEEHALDNLSDCLDQINYRIISPAYRRTLMNYYMACDRMEDAYFGVELYGSDLMEPTQLYLLTCVGLYLHKEERDDLLLTMAYRTFVNRRFNEEVLVYLKKYFEGRVFDLLDLWTVLQQTGLSDVEYEEKVLRQALFVGAKDERIYDLLESYLEKEKNEALTEELLGIYSIPYVLHYLEEKETIQMPDSYFSVLNKEIVRKEFGDAKLPFMLELAFLVRKAANGWREKERPMIARMVKKFCKEQIIFPFFEIFDEFASIPSLWKESFCFWFQGEEKRTYHLCLAASGENAREESRIGTKIRELAPGFYYGNGFLPLFEKKSKGKIAEDGRIVSLLPVGARVRGSRNSLLARMEEEKTGAAVCMKDYETMMGRMERQLTPLFGVQEWQNGD